MDDNFWDGIPARITEARKRAGWNQEQLGEAIGRSKGFIGNYERGDRRPSVRELREIASATNTDLRWLLFGASYQDPLERIELRLNEIWGMMTGDQLPVTRPISDLIPSDPKKAPDAGEPSAAQNGRSATKPRSAGRPQRPSRGGSRRAS